MSALALSRSVRDMPGLRAKPAVVTTTSAPFTPERSLLPSIRPPLCHSGAACCMSSDLPCGIPSTMSIKVTSAMPRSARNSAALAPTLPAPITATFDFKASSLARDPKGLQVEGATSHGHSSPRGVAPDRNSMELAGLGGRRRPDVQALAVAAPASELHVARDHREQRVVLSHPDVETGMEPRAALAHQDVARLDALAAEPLDAQPLRVRLAVVP